MTPDPLDDLRAQVADRMEAILASLDAACDSQPIQPLALKTPPEITISLHPVLRHAICSALFVRHWLEKRERDLLEIGGLLAQSGRRTIVGRVPRFARAAGFVAAPNPLMRAWRVEVVDLGDARPPWQALIPVSPACALPEQAEQQALRSAAAMSGRR